MRLLYLTRVDISSNSAQARQISSMAKAFYDRLGCGFFIITGTPSNCSFPFPHKAIPCAKYLFLRQIFTCLIAAKSTIGNRVDAIFTRDIIVAVVAVLLGGNAIYEAHKEPKGFIARFLTKLLSNSKNFQLVAISEALGSYYADNYNLPRGQQIVAHDGVFVEEYDEIRSYTKLEVRKELGLPRDKIVIIHTGSLYKGGAELFGALLKKKNDFMVIHVGGTRSECNWWQQKYRHEGVDQIRFIPHQPHEKIRKYQVAADLLFYVCTKENPIYWCTSPLKVFEYMATGVPILGARIGSVTEILNESNSFGYDPDDSNTIDMALKEIFNDTSRGEKKAEKALYDCRNKYSWILRVNKIINAHCSIFLKDYNLSK